MAQSLVIFEATEGSFMNATTRVWPDGIDISTVVLILSSNVFLALLSLSKLALRPADADIKSLTRPIFFKGRG
jgi:hypothetical protein